MLLGTYIYTVKLFLKCRTFICKQA